MPNPKPIGNRTDRRGRKLRRDIHLGKHIPDTPQNLRILTLNARSLRNRPDITEDQIVDELIEAAWRAYDAEIQAAAEYEGGVL